MKSLLVALACVPFLAACNKDEPAPADTPPVVQADTVAPTPAADMPSVPATEATEPATAMATAPAEMPATVAPSTVDATVTTGNGSYVVTQGDTLWSIADKHGIAHGDLAKWNNINDPRELQVGRKLTLTAP